MRDRTGPPEVEMHVVTALYSPLAFCVSFHQWDDRQNYWCYPLFPTPEHTVYSFAPGLRLFRGRLRLLEEASGPLLSSP